MKNLLFAAASLPVILGITAASVSDSGSITKKDGTFIVHTDVSTVAITPFGGDIFRVTTLPSESADFRLPASQAVTLSPSDAGISSFITSGEFSLISPTTTVKINRRTGKVIFLNSFGDTLMSEAGGVDNRNAVKNVSLLSSASENFYGAGERGHSLRLNGDTLVMFNRQNYGYTGSDPRISQMGITVPYYASDKGYGVLFDDYNSSTLALGDTVIYESETSKPLSYYFINGNSTLGGTVANYTALTGRQNLPPFWALGYITSKYGYHNQQEALGAIDSLKTRGYPVDGIVFDLYWYGTETDMGRLEWDKKQFPDHKGMLDSLNAMGVNTILISQPYINKIGAIDNYNLLDSKGLLTKDFNGNTPDVTTWVGDAGMFDISNPDTREWLWNRLRPLTAEGLAGWWGDLGEPEVHPLTIMHANGESASEYHNVYGNEWSRLIYDGLRKDFPDMRPILLMRGGTAGLQRYSVFPWTTDVSRSWGGLAPQINLMLNSGISGLGYMSSDIGGFAVDPVHPYDPELYVRWLEMGVFTPVLRTHAQYKPEPYHYPAQENILKKFIKMRYEWLPYNYTLAYENAAYGLPLARPVNIDGKNKESKYANLQDEYLWGENVLVAPVMKAGTRNRKVLFPAGEWINWNNPSQRFKGGSTATVAAPLGTLPLFVKAGSFIPQYTRPIENVTQYDPAYLTVKYFPSSSLTSYTLFDDDRKSPESLKEGNYSLTHFTGIKEGKELTINITTEGSYPGMPETRHLTIEIPASPRPHSVAGATWTYSPATSTLTLSSDLKPHPATSLTLTIRY